MANTLKFKRGLVAGLPTAALGEPLFTTDTFDLYIGNGTGNTRFQKYIASGATTQILRGDGSLYTFPLAISSPSNGQVLKYNGTSWVNDSDAGITGSGSAGQVAYFTGATTQGGSNNLFWDNTNARLGIKTNSPSYGLDLGLLSGTVDASDVGLRIRRNGVSTNWSLFDNVFGALNIRQYDSSSPIIRFFRSTDGSTWTENARFHSTGNFGINTGSTDSGQRLQVNGTGYFSGTLGVGASTPTGASFNVSNNITGQFIFSGGSFGVGILSNGQIQSDEVGGASYFRTNVNTQAAAFSSGTVSHYEANQGTIGAGSSIGSQVGFFANNTLTGATNNFGFYGNIAAATGRWNLYMNGTANNYMAGSLGIGSTPAANVSLLVSKNLSTPGVSYGIHQNGSASVTYPLGIANTPIIAASATVAAYRSFYTANPSIGSGATVGELVGYYVESNFVGATANYGFQGAIPSGTGRWNLYMNGTALNYMNGALLLGSTTSTGEQLQVTGTAKITGATSIVGNLTNTNSNLQAFGSTNYSASTWGISIGNGGVSSNYYKANNQYFQNANGITGFEMLSDGTTSSFSSFGAANYGASTWGIIIGNGLGSTNFYKANTHNFQNGSGTASLTINSAGAVTIPSNLTVDTNTLFVDATNNRVGIGTASPNGRLHAIGSLGDFRLLDSGAEIYLSRDGNNDFYANGGTSAALSIGANNYLRFLTGSTLTERTRITSGGNLLIGTTTDSGYKLRVNGTGYFDDNVRFPNTKGILFENSSASAVGSIKMATGVTNPLEITNGTNTITLVAIGTAISSNLLVGAANIGTSATNTLVLGTGTAPSSSPTDSVQIYSADITAGNAAPHFRTENGAVIKLYQETTAVGNSIISLGGGSAVLDDTTFDGYTLRQIVKALRNQGILQ